MADNLSMSESHVHVTNDTFYIQEEFLNERLRVLDIAEILWYADIVNLLISVIYPPNATSQQKKKLFCDSHSYMWDGPGMFKQGTDRIMRRYISENESKQVLEIYHLSPYEGHHGGERTQQERYYIMVFLSYIVQRCYSLVRECDQC